MLHTVRFVSRAARHSRGVSRVQLALAVLLAFSTLASCGGDKLQNPIDTPPAITRVEIASPITTLAPTQTVQLTVTFRAVDGAAVSGTPVWSSSANAIATVNASGLVTAVAAGTVMISARTGNSISGTVSLTVIPAGGTVTSLTVALSDPALIIGDLGQATLSAHDANNAAVALGNRTILWSSTNTSVATISSAGVIAAVGIGATQIRASVVEGGAPVVGNASLSIVANPDAKQTADVSMPGLTFSPTDVVVKVGGTVRFIFPNLDHNVIWQPRITGAPADIGIMSNQIVTRTFPAAGVFPYVCTLHNGMVGTIVVSP